MISHQDAPDECFSHKSSHLDISEDPLWALMGRVYDPAKNAPSQASPIIARDVLFFPCHRRGWQTFSVFGMEGAFNRSTAIFLSWSKHYCENILFHEENVFAVALKVAETFSLIAHLSQERLVACHFGHLKFFFFFFYQTGLFCSVIPPSGTALILSHDSCSCISTH